MIIDGLAIANKMGGIHDIRLTEWSDTGEQIPSKVKQTIIRIPLEPDGDEGYEIRLFEHPKDPETLIAEFGTYKVASTRNSRGGIHTEYHFKGGGVPKKIKEKLEEGWWRSRPPLIMVANTPDNPGVHILRHYLKKSPEAAPAKEPAKKK